MAQQRAFMVLEERQLHSAKQLGLMVLLVPLITLHRVCFPLMATLLSFFLVRLLLFPFFQTLVNLIQQTGKRLRGILVYLLVLPLPEFRIKNQLAPLRVKPTPAEGNWGAGVCNTGQAGGHLGHLPADEQHLI